MRKAHRLREHAAALDPAAINDPQLRDTVGPGSKGNAVVRAQILLARMHFSCGEIDGAYGANLQRTVTAFQGAHGLRPTGVVDEGTWSELNRDSSPALFEYSISQQDIAGPFVKIPEEMAAKAQLSAMGYESPQEALGEKFHANPKLLIDLNRGKPLDRAGTSILAPNLIRPAPGPAASVVVTKSDTSVVAFDAEQHILAYYSATIGSEHDPLPIGHWKILGVRRNPEFHYNPDLFWDSDPKDSKATIQPGPNNPVGVVWISLSKPHYGIHGTPEPSKIGHTESHGCIRLTNWDAMELASMVKPAMPAILRD